ncbi:MAG: hypothetical protein SV765_00300 [Pseudomonadota bacterium]|nr:hypothetical protein [Pseudomonadota bacterium]
MTEIWEHQQLPRSEIDKMRKEVKIASAALDEARREITEKEQPSKKESKKLKTYSLAEASQEASGLTAQKNIKVTLSRKA